jgi:protein tyrosine phosphatase
MNATNSTPILKKATQYYRDHRERMSKMRLENYYKNRYGTIEPDEIKAVKEKKRKLTSEKRKLANALKVLNAIPNAHQYIMSNLSTNNCNSVTA